MKNKVIVKWHQHNRAPYWITDWRANYVVGDALILQFCDTLEEAKENLGNYNDDECIVEVATRKVVDCLLWRRYPDVQPNTD